MSRWYQLQGYDAAKYKTRLCNLYPLQQCYQLGCFWAHGGTELRRDVSATVAAWRAQQGVRIVHELPEGSGWLLFEWRTQPCIKHLQTGACPAGAACPCAHTQDELQPRPVPVPELRAWLEAAGWHVPPAAGQGELPLPGPAPYHPGAWQAAASIAQALQQTAARQQAAGLAAVSAGGSHAAGLKRPAADVGAAGSAPTKRQHSDALAAAAAPAQIGWQQQHAGAQERLSLSPPPPLQPPENARQQQQQQQGEGRQTPSPDSGTLNTSVLAADVAVALPAGTAPGGKQQGSAASPHADGQPCAPAGSAGQPGHSAGPRPHRAEHVASTELSEARQQLEEAQAARQFLVNAHAVLEQRAAAAAAAAAQAQRDDEALREQLRAVEEDLQAKDAAWLEAQGRAQAAEAAQAAAEKRAAEAERQLADAQRAMNARLQAVEDSNRAYQKQAAEALARSEPALLRAELEVKGKEVADLERQLAAVQAELAAAQAEAAGKGEQMEQLKVQHAAAAEQAQQALQEAQAQAEQAQLQADDQEHEAEVLRGQLAAANARVQQLESSAAAAAEQHQASVAALQGRLEQAEAAAAAAAAVAAALPAADGNEVQRLRQQLQKANKKLELMQGMVKRDAEKQRKKMAEMRAQLAAAQGKTGMAAASAPTNSTTTTPEASVLLDTSQQQQQQENEQLAAAQKAAFEAQQAVQEQQVHLAAAQEAAADAQQKATALQQRVTDLEAELAAAAGAQREAGQRESALQQQLEAAQAEASAKASSEAQARQAGAQQEALLKQQIQQQQDRIVELALQLGQAQQAAENARQEGARAQQTAADAAQQLQVQADGLQLQLVEAQVRLQEQEAAAAAAQQELRQRAEDLKGLQAGSLAKAAERADKLARKLARAEEKLKPGAHLLCTSIACRPRGFGTPPPPLLPPPPPPPPGALGGPLERHVAEVCDATRGVLDPADFRDSFVLELMARMSDHEQHDFLELLRREASHGPPIVHPVRFIAHHAQDFLDGAVGRGGRWPSPPLP
ncbi:hypothetical protein ABPG75_009681 [Micractinium tetrahymenae]